MRIEWTPSHVGLQGNARLRELLDSLVPDLQENLSRATISRLDIAVDCYGAKFTELLVCAKNARLAQKRWTENGDLTGIRVGSRKGKRLLRVYDKARERRCDGRPHCAYRPRGFGGQSFSSILRF